MQKNLMLIPVLSCKANSKLCLFHAGMSMNTNLISFDSSLHAQISFGTDVVAKLRYNSNRLGGRFCIEQVVLPENTAFTAWLAELDQAKNNKVNRQESTRKQTKMIEIANWRQQGRGLSLFVKFELWSCTRESPNL